MRTAIIDLGTNTFNLLILDIEPKQKFEVLLNTKEAVMLGREGFENGNISNQAMNRAYLTIQNFNKYILEFECDKVFAFGTSAIRSAKNSSIIINKVKKDFNIEIKPISGDQEAEYIYHGVKSAVSFETKNYLILDIGGGSNEFIVANKDGLLWKHSFKLGGTRMLNKFKPHDPILLNELNEIQDYFDLELELIKDALLKYPVTKLIGSSGAFDCFAEIINYKKNKAAIAINKKSYEFSLNDFQEIAETLIKSSREERLLIPGLDSIRVDTIVMATIFTQVVLKITNIESIIQSAYSLKEGVASQIK